LDRKNTKIEYATAIIFDTFAEYSNSHN